MSSLNSTYMTTRSFFILLQILLPLEISANFSKGECMACVDQEGCTYCKGEDFFDKPSICVCEKFHGFFGSCSDYTFGGHPFTSKLDCSFNSTQGEVILVVIIVVSVLAFALLGCCYFECKEGNGCNGTEPRISSGHNPAYTLGNATPGNDHVTHAFPIATESAIPSSATAAYAYDSNPEYTTDWSAPPAYVPTDPSAPSAGSGFGGGTSTTFDSSGI